MTYVFFGSPKFAAIILQKLIDGGNSPALVLCNPDRPVGRNQVITPPETKVIAEQNNIPVFQPEKLDEDAHQKLSAMNPQFAVVAAYAKIIPKSVLSAFPKGVVGIHPSLLPKYRGATPIQSAILAGESETGVSMYVVDEKVDHGPVLVQSTYAIREEDTYSVLEEKLAYLGGELAAGLLPAYAEGDIPADEQSHDEATMTKKFTTEDARVDLGRDSAETIARKIRALNPEPGVWTMRDEKRVKLLEVKKEVDSAGKDSQWVITKTQTEGKTAQVDSIILK